MLLTKETINKQNRIYVKIVTKEEMARHTLKRPKSDDTHGDEPDRQLSLSTSDAPLLQRKEAIEHHTVKKPKLDTPLMAMN
ncbi:MAG: hypothetical protein ACRCXC_08400 [Legionella sp.]